MVVAHLLTTPCRKDMHAFGPTSRAERRHEDGQLFMLELHRARLVEKATTLLPARAYLEGVREDC